MRILALDTATEACSVALLDRDHCYYLSEICPGEHTQRILPMVDQLLKQQSVCLSQLQAIAFGRGPGSFTGVRVGIGVAQGLGLGANLPLLGVSTLATMAQGAWRVTAVSRVLTAIDARMGEVYWAEYQRDAQGYWQGEATEALLTPEAAAQRLCQLTGEWVTAGSGWQKWPEMTQNRQLLLRDSGILCPAAQDMLPLAVRLYQQQAAVAAEHSKAVYLRNNVAWQKPQLRRE